MSKIGPTLRVVQAGLECTGCDVLRDEYYSFEDGNDCDSGFNYYCDASGGRRIGYGVKTPEWCPHRPAIDPDVGDVAQLRAELEQARIRIAECECWANSFSDVRAHVNMCKELEQARAERDEAVARLGRADFMVDAAFERGRASTLIEQHGSISEVEDKPAPAPAAGAVGVERLRAMAEEWHKPADRRRFIDDKTRGGFELGRDECADELLALANEAAADGEG
jgi:hypothetical protein